MEQTSCHLYNTIRNENRIRIKRKRKKKLITKKKKRKEKKKKRTKNMRRNFREIFDRSFYRFPRYMFP